MKRNRSITTAAASISAAVMLAASAGAYLTPAAAPNENLTSDQREWSLIIPEGQTDGVEGIKKLELVISLDGDAEQYEREKASGVYESDGETVFVDFTGHIGIGAKLMVNDSEENWYDFGYKGLVTSTADKMAVIEQLNDNTYLFSCDLESADVLKTDRDVQFTFKDWGNTSTGYSLTVNEFYAYYSDGTVAVYADADGNADIDGHDPLDRSKYAAAEETPAETSAEAVATEAPETTATTAAPETTETTSAAADTAAETTEAAITENNGSSAAPAGSGTVQAVPADFGSRDMSLIIVGIIAGVVIIALIVVIVLVLLKKKK